MNTTATWTSGVAFSAAAGPHHVPMDGLIEHGGRHAAPTPKELLLASLAGCLGVSVMTVLHKMRLHPERFEVQVQGTEAQSQPKVFTEIRVTCRFTGALPAERLERAVQLSESRYCPVSAMLAKACPVRVTTELNGVSV